MRRVERLPWGVLFLLSACAGRPLIAPPELPAPDRYLHDPASIPAPSIPAPSVLAPSVPAPSVPAPPGLALSGEAPSSSPRQTLVQGMEVPVRWWESFGSPRLNGLIASALQASPDLAAAQAALRAAQANAEAQRGALYPAAQLALGTSRQRNPVGTLAPTLSSGAPVFNLQTAQVTVYYAPDVFGGAGLQLAAARALVEVQQMQREASALTLVANLVLAAIQQASLDAQIESTRALLALQREQLAAQEQARRLGAAADADLLAQQALIAQTEAQLPVLQRQRAQQRDLLALLSGQTPGAGRIPEFGLDDFHLPDPLPLSLPGSLVAHRPDVRAAEAGFRAASAAAGVAYTSRLPQISLTAALGGTSTGLRDLFAGSNTFWSAGASLAQTLFDGRALAQREQAAIAQAEQAAALWRGAALLAFQGAADALEALSLDAQAFDASRRAESTACAALDAARKAQALGATGVLPVLQADQNCRQASVGLIQARASRLADTVALYQALGGGWWQQAANDEAIPTAPAR